jgi:hypothetical protein
MWAEHMPWIHAIELLPHQAQIEGMAKVGRSNALVCNWLRWQGGALARLQGSSRVVLCLGVAGSECTKCARKCAVEQGTRLADVAKLVPAGSHQLLADLHHPLLHLHGARSLLTRLVVNSVRACDTDQRG